MECPEKFLRIIFLLVISFPNVHPVLQQKCQSITERYVDLFEFLGISSASAGSWEGVSDR